MGKHDTAVGQLKLELDKAEAILDRHLNAVTLLEEAEDLSMRAQNVLASHQLGISLARLRQDELRESIRALEDDGRHAEPALTMEGIEVTVYRSSLEFDRGQPVVQIDGAGMVRVNMNDFPIWNADPEQHEHEHCGCVKRFELKSVG